MPETSGSKAERGVTHPREGDRAVVQGHAGAARVVAWMLHEGRANTHMREFGDDMCRRVVEAGIPLWRAFCGIRTLHPQIAASAYVWRRGETGAERRTAVHGMEKTPAFTQSPLTEVTLTGRAIRRRLDDAGADLGYAILDTFRLEGGTDYVAMPMVFSSGEINCISWLTDRPGGFTEAEIAGLTDVAEMLTVIVETQTTSADRARAARYLRRPSHGRARAVGRGQARRRRDHSRGHLVLRFARLHEFVGRVAARCAARSAQRVFRNHGERRHPPRAAKCSNLSETGCSRFSSCATAIMSRYVARPL